MKLLIIDVSNVMHRNFHAVLASADRGQATAATVIFLRQLDEWGKRFNPNAIVFAFDSGEYKRRKILPTYKVKPLHDPFSQFPVHDTRFLRQQLAALESTVLRRIGFTNIFSLAGYEADDIIANIVAFNEYSSAVIVSTDKDLYQCLSPKVSIYDQARKLVYDEKAFQAEYDIAPSLWPLVKAMAGCKSDRVPGIKGVGEKTAILSIKKQLAHNTRGAKQIALSREQIERNVKLTTLPFPGMPLLTVKEVAIKRAKWDSVFAEMVG